MLGLEIDSEFLDLTANAGMNITGSNPAFDPDAISRLFSYPFRIPGTPRNLRLLRHANRLDHQQSLTADTKPAVKCWVSGAIMAGGNLSLLEATASTVECSFGNVDKGLVELWDTIRIRSLMPTINIPQEYEAEWIFELQPVGGVPEPYEVTINAVVIIFDASGGGYTQSQAGQGLRDAINAVYPGTATYTGGSNQLRIIPLDNDPFVINDVLFLDVVTTRTKSQAEQQNLLEYLDGLLTTPAASHSFPSLQHFFFYADKNPPYCGQANYNHDEFGVNQPDEGAVWKYTYVPYVSLKYVFDQIAAASGIAWSGDFYESTDFSQLRIFSNYALDKVRYEYFFELSEYRYLNGGRQSFNLADHVPDLTAREFLVRVFDFFNLYTKPATGTDVRLLRRRDQVAVRPLVWSAEISPEYKLTVRPKKGVTLRFVADGSDNISYPDNLEDYVIGAGGILKEAPIRPLNDTTVSDPVTETQWRLAAVNQRGSSDEKEIGTQPFAFRLFFDRGIQQDLGLLNYHMSTHLDTDMAGNTIGELSLEWDGDQGLYQKLWRGWAELDDKEPLELRAVLPVAVVRGMLQWDKPVIAFYHPQGVTRAIVKNIQFEASTDDADMVEVRMETIKL